VVSEDLERVGSVQRLTFDASGHLLDVTVRLVFDNAKVEVLATLISAIDDGSLYLHCTRHDLNEKRGGTTHTTSTDMAMPA
jgi:hypothetical protein